MMDFATGRILRLGPVDVSTVEAQILTLLMDGEQVFLPFKGGRDFVVFTDKHHRRRCTGDPREQEGLHVAAVQEDPGVLR